MIKVQGAGFQVSLYLPSGGLRFGGFRVLPPFFRFMKGLVVSGLGFEVQALSPSTFRVCRVCRAEGVGCRVKE